MTYEEMLLEVDLNRQGVNKSLLVLRRGDGMFLLKAQDLAAFRLKMPSTAPYVHDEMPFFPVDALPGARFELDEIHQRLTIMAGAEAFESTVDYVPGSRAYPTPIRPSLGGFLNYDVSAVGGGGSTFTSGTLEGGFFTPLGVLVSSYLATHDETGSRGVRLDTTFTSDFPSRHTTLRIGDAISRPGVWGTAARFGGVQYGTNFSTDPGLVTFPTQPIRGQAIVPSFVDVYVNNALIATRRVEPGPFSITNIPFTTGSGTVRMVVRDLSGQQQVISVSNPFYSSNTLLKEGLADYSAELGKIRENVGLESFGYGEPIAMGTYRRGITDRFTAELHGEGDRSQRALGVSATALHPILGQADATLAASRSDAGTGELVGLGYQRQAIPFSFAGQGQWSSPDFRRAGDLEGQPRLRLQEAFSVGLQMGAVGSITTAWLAQRFHDKPSVSIVSVGYSLGLGKWGQFNLNALRSKGEQTNTVVAAGITVPLALNMNASVQAEVSGTGDQRSRDLVMSFQRSRSGDSPYSYRVVTRDRDIEGVFDYRANRFETELGLARTQGNAYAGRAQVSGGIGYVGGYAFLSRRITSSFGVVKVADYPDVEVYFDNQFVGRTNERGFFVVPELRAYDRNVISIREQDVPLDATIGALKLDASPYFRSGILVEFPVKRSRAATLTVELDGGALLPSGAVVRVDDAPEEFPSAMNGEVYVTGLAAKGRLVVQWKEQACTIDVVYPDTKDPLPDLGRFVCKGVRP